MKNCSHLYFLSTLACQLAECLTEDETSVLAADLLVLSDMLSDILARQDACKNICAARDDKVSAVSDATSDTSFLPDARESKTP